MSAVPAYLSSSCERELSATAKNAFCVYTAHCVRVRVQHQHTCRKVRGSVYLGAGRSDAAPLSSAAVHALRAHARHRVRLRVQHLEKHGERATRAALLLT